jgi:hypothetical protein
MIPSIVPYVSSLVIIVWGFIHITRTRRMVTVHEPSSVENRRILTMAWVAQGLTLIFIGLLVLGVRYIYGGCEFTYPMATLMLLGVAAWTTFTGSRTSDRFLKMSPVVEVIVAALLLYSDLVLLRIL